MRRADRRNALQLATLLLASAASAGAPVVDDVSRLNPIPVERVATPITVADVQTLVRSHSGPHLDRWSAP